MLVHQLILAEHPGSTLHLGDAGGEVVVPEERELFAQRVRPVEHAGDPPAAGLPDVLPGIALHDGSHGREIGRRRAWLQQARDRFLRTIGERGLQLGPRAAKRRPAIEVPGLLQVPRVIGTGLIRRPRPARVNGVGHDDLSQKESYQKVLPSPGFAGEGSGVRVLGATRRRPSPLSPLPQSREGDKAPSPISSSAIPNPAGIPWRPIRCAARRGRAFATISSIARSVSSPRPASRPGRE